MTDKKWYFDTIEEAKAAMPKWKKIYKAVNKLDFGSNCISGYFVPVSSKCKNINGNDLCHVVGSLELIEKRQKEPSKAHTEKAKSIGAKLVSGYLADRHILIATHKDIMDTPELDNSLPVYGSSNALSKAFNDACKRIAESIQKDALKLRPITDFLPKQQDEKMTLQNQAKELLPFVQAMAEGKEVQVKVNDLWCKKVTSNFMLGEEYRIAPETIIVNGFEIEAPMKEAPEYGVQYYISVTDEDDYHASSTFDMSEYDYKVIRRGLCHKTRSAAIAHAKAMIGVNPNE